MARPTDFKFARWAANANFCAQAVLLLLLFVGSSYLASQYFHRVDLTRQHRYSLSPETMAYLGQLERSVKIYVTITGDHDDNEMNSLFRDVRGLLREYEYGTRGSTGGQIEVEFVNVYQQRGKASLLAEQYGVREPEIILLVSGDKRRIVFPNELYLTSGRERKQFRGERTLTGAILDVSSDQQKKLYFISGHGEMRMEDVDPVRGLSQLGDALRHRNFKLENLDLSTVTRVPEDADMVLIISPQGPILPQEEEILRQYLSTQAGRLLIMIDPARRHGMEELFFEWGVLVDDVVVLDSGPDFLATGGDLLLRRFGDHQITRTLIENQIPVMVGLCRSVRPDPGRPLTDSLQVQALIGTSEKSWGERSYSQGGSMRYDEGLDILGPLSIATVSERTVSSLMPINIPGGRLTVFGTSDFITNNRIGALGNLTLFLNAVNWATDRDTIVNIPPRPIDSVQLVLSQNATQRLRLSMLVFFPGTAALLGIIVYWIRRK